ncbi:MAG: NUDIX domain-containing protein [Pseudomonadota bacterium]
MPTSLERFVLHPWWRMSRGMTLGVRGLVQDPERGVFLIRHSYTPGWHLPGGGVERGETLLTALHRELLEEGNITLNGTPTLFNVYASPRFRGDHVALFLISDWQQRSAPVPDREIIDHGFFPRDALPDDATAGTKRRLAEVFDGAKPDEHW